MWIFGYNENKQVFEVDVPMERVLSLGIDPWQLDLFDPDPVALSNIGGVRLYFRKMREIIFAYELNSRAYLGVYDGSKAVCLESDCFELWHDSAGLLKLRPSTVPFNLHLARFYERTAAHAESTNQVRFGYARSCSSVKLIGERAEVEFGELDRETLKTKHLGPCPVYTGSMFETIPLVVPLTEEMNWAIENFGQLQPIIHGPEVSQFIGGPRANGVRIMVSRGREDELRMTVKNLLDTSIKYDGPDQMDFHHKGTFYHAWFAHPETYTNQIKEPARVCFWHCLSSDDGVCATGVNRVYATRIALYDISQRKIRPITRSAHQQLIAPKDWWQKLSVPEGWTLEPIVYRSSELDRSAITGTIPTEQTATRSGASSPIVRSLVHRALAA